MALSKLHQRRDGGSGGQRFYISKKATPKQQRRTNAHGGAATSESAIRGRRSAARPRGKSNPPEAAPPVSNKKNEKAAAEGAKVVQELRRELVGAAQSVVDKAEAECEAMFATALEGCSVWTVAREKDDEVEQTALREMESRRASADSRSSKLLREIETNQHTLSEMSKRFATTLNGVVQAESRKIKSSLDRITCDKS